MKSYISRFLYHIMSYSGLTRISRWNKFANWFDLDTPIKSECDSYCAGRSMVEMLGVLAIIGVLSVGAIAGYSKAMMKYKLNKHAEQMNTVINAVARNAHSFGNIEGGRTIVTYLIKMGEVPNEMVKQGHNSYIYDIFNNYYYATIQPQSMTDDEKVKGVVAFYIRMPITTKSTENLLMCQNIYNNIKENSANIYYVYSSSGYKTDDARQSKLWGDKYCTSNAKCLKDLSVEKLSEECSLHIGNKSNGHIVVLWKM